MTPLYHSRHSQWSCDGSFIMWHWITRLQGAQSLSLTCWSPSPLRREWVFCLCRDSGTSTILCHAQRSFSDSWYLPLYSIKALRLLALKPWRQAFKVQQLSARNQAACFVSTIALLGRCWAFVFSDLLMVSIKYTGSTIHPSWPTTKSSIILLCCTF